MQKAFVNGINMYYQIIGEGFPLVAVMGLDANMDWWLKETQDELSRRYKLIIFDNRGAGRSDAPEQEAYTIPQMASDTIALLDELGINEFYLLGVSMGGMISQQIALDYPNRVKKLILGCTYCSTINSVRPPVDLKTMMKDPQKPTPQELLKLLYPMKYIIFNLDKIKIFGQRAAISPTTPKSHERHFNGILQFDLSEQIKNIDIPTLIMVGEKDILIHPENSRILNQHIKNSKLVSFKDCGHGFWMQDEKKVIKNIIEFLG